MCPFRGFSNILPQMIIQGRKFAKYLPRLRGLRQLYPRKPHLVYFLIINYIDRYRALRCRGVHEMIKFYDATAATPPSIQGHVGTRPPPVPDSRTSVFSWPLIGSLREGARAIPPTPLPDVIEVFFSMPECLQYPGQNVNFIATHIQYDTVLAHPRLASYYRVLAKLRHEQWSKHLGVALYGECRINRVCNGFCWLTTETFDRLGFSQLNERDLQDLAYVARHSLVNKSDASCTSV